MYNQTIMSKLIICIYILNGFFFNTLSVESANRFPSFLNLYRSLNERKFIIFSKTSSGKSNKDFCFKQAILLLGINCIFAVVQKSSLLFQKYIMYVVQLFNMSFKAIGYYICFRCNGSIQFIFEI